MAGNLPLRCLTKWMPSFLYQSYALFDSNIPSKIFFAPSSSEIPRIARITTELVTMITRGYYDNTC